MFGPEDEGERIRRRPRRAGVRTIERQVAEARAQELSHKTLEEQTAEMIGNPDVFALMKDARWSPDNGITYRPLFDLQGGSNLRTTTEFINIFRRILQDESIDSQTAVATIANTIGKLIKTRHMQVRNGIGITDADLVFESPFLEGPRREEAQRISLQGMRRKPTHGVTCRKNTCTSTDVYLIEKYIRSGDEPAVIFNECSRCGTRWND